MTTSRMLTKRTSNNSHNIKANESFFFAEPLKYISKSDDCDVYNIIIIHLKVSRYLYTHKIYHFT